MTLRKITNPDVAIAQVFSPIRNAPTEQGDKTVTNTAAVLFNDLTNTDGYNARRVRVYNTDASATLGLFFVAAGTAPAGAITAAMKIGPGLVWEGVISNGMRVNAISSAASQSCNVLVHDV